MILRTLGIKADPATYFTKYMYPRKGISVLFENMAAAVRQLTPGAPDDLDRLDPANPAVSMARPSSSAVRDARRALLEGLAAVPAPSR